MTRKLPERVEAVLKNKGVIPIIDFQAYLNCSNSVFAIYTEFLCTFAHVGIRSWFSLHAQTTSTSTASKSGPLLSTIAFYNISFFYVEMIIVWMKLSAISLGHLLSVRYDPRLIVGIRVFSLKSSKMSTAAVASLFDLSVCFH